VSQNPKKKKNKPKNYKSCETQQKNQY